MLTVDGNGGRLFRADTKNEHNSSEIEVKRLRVVNP